MVDEAGLEVGVVRGSLSGGLRQDDSVCFCRLGVRRFRGPHVVGTRDARHRLQRPETVRPSFFTVFVGYDFWMGSFDVNGGAVVLLERRLFPVCGPRQCRPQLGLQLLDGALDGVFRHERCCGGVADRLADTRFVSYDSVDLNWDRYS